MAYLITVNPRLVHQYPLLLNGKPLQKNRLRSYVKVLDSKSDSPRLNKLRTKLKDETNTRDLLNSLFDIDFIEGTPPKQLNAGVLRTEDGLDVACVSTLNIC